MLLLSRFSCVRLCNPIDSSLYVWLKKYTYQGLCLKRCGEQWWWEWLTLAY